LIWGGPMDNHFGTAEFVKYAREIGAEPFLVANMSTGTPEEAANWVEYCNGTEDTYYANLRRKHGYEEPFNVKYWGIGNEEYAVPDAGKHQNVDKYIEDSWQFVKLMKLHDPSIKITLVGSSDDLDWSRKVTKSMHQVSDYLAIHLYVMPWNSEYSTLLEKIEQFSGDIDSVREIIESVPEKVEDFPHWYRFPPRPEPLKIAIDEWGIWDMKSGKGFGVYGLEYQYNWAHALTVGRFLNLFQRNADIIGLATWAQTVNVLPLITTSEKGMYEQTVYTPMHSHRKYMQDNNMPISVSAPTLPNPKIKSLDATASISNDNNKIVISLINLRAPPEIQDFC
jgi:alpha-L-arabinofuranosidase